MGRITGLMTVLANRSPSRSSAAPPKTEPGIRYTWLLPTTIRTMCGATRPIKLMSHTQETTTELHRQHSTMPTRVSRFTLIPRLMAVSSPLKSAL